MDKQGARAPSIFNFANQFKCIAREKSKSFVLKIATLGTYLPFL